MALGLDPPRMPYGALFRLINLGFDLRERADLGLSMGRFVGIS